jgi:hypothetical protein
VSGGRGRGSEKTHLAREAVVEVVEFPTDSLDVRAGVEVLHRIRVKPVEDRLLAHTDLEVYAREGKSW